VTAFLTAVRIDHPPGYAAEREHGAEVVALPSIIGAVRDALQRAETLYQWAATQPDARPFTGRGAAYGVRTPHGDWVVRHYRRGGMVARVLGDRYIRSGVPRPWRELAASAAARERGVATPEVVAAVVYPAGPFYRADLATRLIPDSTDLAEAVLGVGRGDAGLRQTAWHAAGSLLRQAFAAGVVHADLNLRNILIQRGDAGTSAFLLDLDRAEVSGRAVSGTGRSAMLQRLHRSRRKLERMLGARTSSAELAAFESALRGERQLRGA
jgi:3-deoxy-D-manno-octulosonic acid kinase